MPIVVVKPAFQKMTLRMGYPPVRPMDGKLQPSAIFPSLSSLFSQIEFAWGGDNHKTVSGFRVNYDDLRIGMEARVY